jgi:hypothetical protein
MMLLGFAGIGFMAYRRKGAGCGSDCPARPSTIPCLSLMAPARLNPTDLAIAFLHMGMIRKTELALHALNDGR